MNTAPAAASAAAPVETAARSSRYRKALLPLSTLVIAGAVAIGSGATFTSTTGNTISAVTSGTLTHTNSKDGAAIFDLTNVKPGDTLTGSLSLKNTGSLDADFGLTETQVRSNRTALVNATMAASTVTAADGSIRSVVTLRLGTTASGATRLRTVKTASTMVWSPSVLVTDLNGRASAPTTVTESGAADKEF